MQIYFSNTTRLFIIILLLAAGIMAAPAVAGAEMSLSFTPIEEAKFLIAGAGWEDAASLDVIVDYDAAFLAEPEATIMGGMLQTGPRLDVVPGRLQFRVINNGQSPNFEVCVFFQKRGEQPAVIHSVTAAVIGRTGRVYRTPVAIRPNPNTPRKQDAEPERINATEQSEASGEAERENE